MQNPSTKEHFIYKRWIENNYSYLEIEGEQIVISNHPNVEPIHTTYHIAEKLGYLSQSFLDKVNDIKEKNYDKYKHKYLGGWLDKAEGVVFTNWKFGKFNPDGLQTSFGQDYGFSVDPTTLIEVAIDKKKKRIYAKEHLYKARLTTSQIGEINKRVCGHKLIIGDSAEPRLIQELSNMGCNIYPAEKGQGSISLGVALLLDYELIIEGENLAKELNNYIYADKGSKMFVDDFNHLIDPLRYNVTYHLGGSGGIEIR